MKKFIITIDTEGDNLWDWHEGDKIITNNVLYLNRFQKLCNKYGFKPVWLTNYEMISDDNYVNFIKEVIEKNNGEIGMHLHAWNNPPYYELEIVNDGAPYLIEYPPKIIEEKIKYLTNLIYDKTGVYPVSHRAGRWATNSFYMEMLDKYGYKIDCSYTPYVNWNKSFGRTANFYGSDYSKIKNKIYKIKNNLYEYPCTIIKVHKFDKLEKFSLKGLLKSIYHFVKAKYLWLRPNGRNIDDMLYILNKMKRKKNDYVMFMIHSSELMPGGSPTFKTPESIEKLYSDLEILFSEASKSFEGANLKDLV